MVSCNEYIDFFVPDNCLSLNCCWQSLVHIQDGQGRQGNMEVQLLHENYRKSENLMEKYKT